MLSGQRVEMPDVRIRHAVSAVARPSAKTMPAAMAGRQLGSSNRQNVFQRLTPSPRDCARNAAGSASMPAKNAEAINGAIINDSVKAPASSEKPSPKLLLNNVHPTRPMAIDGVALATSRERRRAVPTRGRRAKVSTPSHAQPRATGSEVSRASTLIETVESRAAKTPPSSAVVVVVFGSAVASRP